MSDLLKTCSNCDKTAIGWFWSKDQGYVGWCRDHVDKQTIEVNEESFR
jgi:hypothetical protein